MSAATYTEEQLALSNLGKALAHPARIAILQHLARVRACIGNEIVDSVPLAQPTISRHLKELKAAGLISGTVEGNKTSFCINDRGWARLTDAFGALFACCGPDRCC